MSFKKLKFIKASKGFTLMETMMYLLIMGMLLLVIASLVANIFNARRQMQASDFVHTDARFIVNFLNNRIHNVDIITDVAPAVEQFHFYQLPDTRFSLQLEDEDLVYRQTLDIGGGFSEQATADPIILNNDRVKVSDFNLTSVSDSQGRANQGVMVDFTLTVSQPDDNFGYFQKSFNTFFSIR